MASTYSQTLRIELIGNGDQSGTWGDTTNINLGTLIEAAITGVQPIIFADANYTLTAFNGLPDEARNAVLVLGGTNTVTRNLIAPSVEKTYIVRNNTGASVVIKTASGAGVTISNNTTRIVYCDGTDFFTAASQTVVVAGTGMNVSTVADTSTVALANTGVNAASYSYPTIAVNAQGQITSASNNTPVTTITGTANAISASASTGAVTLSIASNSNGFGVRTVSTSAPTGGSDGDIWYQV